MDTNFEGSNVVRMLYSPEFHESSKCASMAYGTPRTGGSSPASFARAGDGGNCSGGTPAAGIQLRQNYGQKEAQSIGMNSGHGRLILRLTRFERFEVSGLVNRGVLAALAILLAGLAFAPPAHAQSASTWNKRGQAAELREDYDTAYEDYLKAKQKSPKDMRYQARVDRMRFQAAAQHVPPAPWTRLPRFGLRARAR